jgi:F0F1-type ATP synthase assembly protein I
MPDNSKGPEGGEQPPEMPLPESLEHLRPGGGKSGLQGAGKYAGVGVQFVVAILIFLKLGQWADRRFGTDPLFLYIGVFTGAGAAFYSMYRGLMADQRKADAADKAAKAAREQGTKGPGSRP